MLGCWLRQLKPSQWFMPNLLIDASLGDRVGVKTKIALTISVINLTMPVLGHL